MQGNSYFSNNQEHHAYLLGTNNDQLCQSNSVGGAGDNLKPRMTSMSPLSGNACLCSSVPPLSAVVFSLQRVGCWQPWPS